MRGLLYLEMAIVTLPPGSPGFNKSQGGANFSQNRAGFYIKSRKKGLVFNTPISTARRANFRNVTARWRHLNFATRITWLNASIRWPRFNNLGQQYFLTPFQIFTSFNTARVNQGYPIKDIAPSSTASSTAYLISIIMDIDPIDMSIFFFPSIVTVQTEFRIWASNIYSDGYVPLFPEAFKWIHTLLPGDATNFTLWPYWQAVYGPGPTNVSGVKYNWAIYFALEVYYPLLNQVVFKNIIHGSIIQ